MTNQTSSSIYTLTQPSTMRSFLSLKCLLPVVAATDRGISPASRPIGMTPDCCQRRRVQACFGCILGINKAVISIPPCIALHSTPEELNIVQTAVKLWVKDTLVTACSNLNLKHDLSFAKSSLSAIIRKAQHFPPFSYNFCARIRPVYCSSVSPVAFLF